LNINYENIASLYQDLNEDLKKRREIPPAAEWLLDNFYIIEEQVKCIRKDLNKKNYSRLPVLKAGPHKGHARIYTVIMDLVSQTDGQLDESTILKYLTDYQSQNTLFDREIWAIPVIVQLCLLESMKHICENIKETQEQWDKADEIADNWLSESNFDLEMVMKLFESNIEGKHGINASFAEHMSYLLRRSERNCAPALEFIHETLSRLGTTIEIITQKEHHAQSIYAISMANNISSLKFVFGLDWTELFVAVSHIDQILRKDPAGIYPQMDLVTRNYYRSKIEEIALTYGISEFQVAEEAVRLAQRALKSMNEIDPIQKNNPQEVRKYHVGYYLFGKGRDILLAKHGGKRYPFSLPAIVVKRHPHLFYIGFSSLFVILLVFVAVEYLFLDAYPQSPLNYLIAVLAVLLPATEISVNIINWIICKSLAPALIPRLELKNGIPENLSTFVVIPALLPDLKRIEELLKKLESHYLSNRENNLYFALIGAFKDSTEPAINDDEKIVKAALTGIRELNRKYADQGKEKFFFFHRKSRYNKANNKWIGWERKRGALLEFNDLVLGSKNTSFLNSSSSTPPFSNIKYVITLDSDTLLPIGTARKLIGAMAHPLNTPVIDKQLGIVIEGYGIMQPGIDFDGESSNKSLFSRIFTGQSGIDPYANAVSNVYQDLFGEGIYTGKGIYDLKAFQGILRDAIPENSVLSHDLLEGSYVRTALVTDTKLIDSYPSNYNAYSARLHRWVRGDWQLLPFLVTKIYDVNHNKIANPLSFLSKWKMLDNLRRSLIPPALVLLVALSFTILPGNIIFWLSYLTISLFIPFIIAVIDYAFSGFFFKYRVKRYIPVVSGLKASLLQVLLTFVFLPYQAFLMLRAIFITLSRVFITKKNLLEWVTQADIEKNSQNTIWFFLSEMFSSIWIPVIIAALAFVYRPEIFYVSLCFLAVWAIAPLIACKISLDLKESSYTLSREDLDVMGVTARRTWRYFEDFVNITNNYLAPDNYQVHPPKGIAHRTSPTDIGLGLMATLAARDLGYLCTSRMFYDLDKTITTIEKLEKWNGHLYNWYDTHTLEPLRPAYVSSVDSGNLVGYLITLKEGLTEYLSRPVIEDNIINGIHDTLYTCGDEGNNLFESLEVADHYPGKGNCGALLIYRLLKEVSDENLMQKICKPFWREKFRKMIYYAKIEIENFLPGLLFLDKIP
ncbi:MAG TPA: hypothetical protein VN373_04670, partial [Methanosarcina barkeri]|nr:hypothetical protein [Methanosarcina barkeri]